MTLQENIEHQIKTYDELYRAGQPLCSDEVYDKLLEELKDKYPDSELLKKGVIGGQKITRKEKLPVPMYSLEKCKSVEEVRQWLRVNNIPDSELLIITPKFDGISLLSHSGSEKAWTRGDGEFGQVCSPHFELIGKRYLYFDDYFFGEAIISKNNWEEYFEGKINPYSGEPYKVARNTTAGLFNRDTPSPELSHVHYLRFGTGRKDSKTCQLMMCNVLNSVRVPDYCLDINAAADAGLSLGDLFQNLYEIWSEKYAIDGLVIDVNSAELRESLGREENGNPKYAVAFKDPKWSGVKSSKILGITWKVSKQGKLKPVINIEPVQIGGVEVSNVTGYNASYVFDWELVKGSEVVINRSGDVIPKIISVNGVGIPFREEFNSGVEFVKAYNTAKDKFPDGNIELEDLMDDMTMCPCCGGVLSWDQQLVELICSNPNCKEKLISKIFHFFNVLGVEGFGEPSIISLFDSGWDTIDKIISANKTSFKDIPGWGLQSSYNLVEQLDKLKSNGVPFAKLLHALDVMEGKLGETTIQLILDNYDISEGVETCSVEELIKIKGVGEITARQYKVGLEHLFMMYNQLSSIPFTISYFKTPSKIVSSDKYKGWKICFTGVRPSENEKEIILNGGGEIVSGVSKNTTHLVVKDFSDKVLSSSKAVTAKKLNIKLLKISEFFI